MTETFTTKYDSGLDHLAPGDIWATKSRGVFVVLKIQGAAWRGEDRDVYGHIYNWLTCRPATVEEVVCWNRAVAASAIASAQRKALNAEHGYTFDGVSKLLPSSASTRRLDSYDDRWEPPAAINLTHEQVHIEQEYAEAMKGLKGAAIA